jgi:predicted RNase H-like HicB family nuclease
MDPAISGAGFVTAEASVLDWSRRSTAMKLQLTAVFEKVPEGYIGYVEELPGANTQARTLDQARASLAEAVELIFEANRARAEERLADRDVIREPLRITA